MSEKIDKRTINGNNGTRRGLDKQPRKRPTGYYVLKDEVKAGLRARMETVLEFYGGIGKLAKVLKISRGVVVEWEKRGMISARGCQRLHNLYKRTGSGFRASWCRYDLRFDGNGKPLTLRCDKHHYLHRVKDIDLIDKPVRPNWRHIKARNAAKREAEAAAQKAKE